MGSGVRVEKGHCLAVRAFKSKPFKRGTHPSGFLPKRFDSKPSFPLSSVREVVTV